MKGGRQTVGSLDVRLTRSAAALLVPLLLASVACGTTAPTQAVGPVLGLTLPPAWTPTAYIPPGFAEGWATFAGNGGSSLTPVSKVPLAPPPRGIYFALQSTLTRWHWSACDLAHAR